MVYAGNLKKNILQEINEFMKQDKIFNEAGFLLALSWKRSVLQTSWSYNRNKVWLLAEVTSHQTVKG